MKKNRLLRQFFAAAVILTLLVTALPVAGSLAAADDGQEIGLPPLEKLQKGHPKLQSVLDELTTAEQTKGSSTAATFAEQRSIDLVGGTVRVIIEAVARTGHGRR